MNQPSLPPLAVIAGPTASGKSAFALALARSRAGIIINADASQCYADLSILSARPVANDMQDIEHRLYGFLPAHEPLSAAAWAQLARAEIARAHASGMLPIVVGGTGLYLRTLLRGIAPVPDVDATIRSVVRAMSTAELAYTLEAEDPVMAARLHSRDTQRMARALEVVRSAGRSLAEFQAETAGGIEDEVKLEPLVVEVDRNELYRRCDSRFDIMMKRGALDEVANLIVRRLDPALPVMKAIGVPPLLQHLAGAMSSGETVARAKLDTRQYAKRQLTWFRSQTPSWPRTSS